MKRWPFVVIGVFIVIFLFSSELFENSIDESYNPKTYIQTLDKITIENCSSNNIRNEMLTLSQQKTDIDSSIYANFSFPPVDIEVNGHEIKFNREKVRQNPEDLTIHLVFHSHVDPGWLKTFEDYYKQQTSHILDSAVKALHKYPELRFIWSETSFLERWWRDASEIDRKKMTDLVHNGKLEITGGAWVMTDEATPLFYPAIENMIEGHQFIWDTLKVRPNTSWSVDPFGHGAMLPYLLPKAGIDYMVIGRFHDHIKEHLRQHQTLRWRWNDLYTNDQSSGPYVNSLPYFVYTTESACPDSSICRCFHVGPSSRASCSPQDRMVSLDAPKLEKLTKRFLSQIKQVQKLYGSKHHLVAIGDDFFFQDPADFDEMFHGFNQMKIYLDRFPEYRTKIRFSTVSDFYNAVKDENIPSLRGDLFPYTSNRNQPNPWWTGYFTHRPFTKRMERVLQANIQQLDLLLHLEKSRVYDYESLREAKRNLALYQHHDGITGTSKKPVMADYEQRMVKAYEITKRELNKLMNSSLTRPDLMESDTILQLKENKKIYITVFNSNIFTVNREIKVVADTPARVFRDNKDIQAFIVTSNANKYEMLFTYDLPAMSTTVFELIAQNAPDPRKPPIVAPLLIFDQNNSVKSFIHNGFLRVLRINFFEIDDTGGAYTFEPRGDKRIVNISHYEESFGPTSYKRKIFFQNRKLVVTISNSHSIEDGIDIDVDTDVPDNEALFMSISTDLNTNAFHTDINGLFHRKRKFMNAMDNAGLPYEANFYPVAASVFLEDDESRLTVLTGQPLSATSPRPGELHLMMDRRQTGQDGKGLWFGDALDSRSAHVKYRIIFEEKSKNQVVAESPALSQLATSHWNDMLYPPSVMYSDVKQMDKKWFDFEWPCSIQLVSWRPISSKASLLVLRRTVFDSAFALKKSCTGKLEDVYNYLRSRSSDLLHTSLSGIHDSNNVTIESLKTSLEKPYSIVTLRVED
ncbi:unnamed protein product [Auanema sp. JU1783]|nr:unnamed protein product [Auanema sp. JU1783]